MGGRALFRAWTLIRLGTGAAFVCSVVATVALQVFPASFISMGRVAVHFEAAAVIISLTSPDTTRDARLEARVSSAQKRLLQQAAALSGRTLSEFVVASAQDAARRVIAEHESMLLSREAQLAFVTDLLNPPEPNARLKRAAYRQRTGT